MLEALIAGERDPAVLAGLARGKLKATHGALAEALAGRFDDHHAELARMLLDQIDALGGQIGMLTTSIEELLAAIPAAHGVDADGTTGPGAGSGPDAVVLPAVARLDEISGIGPGTAQVIIAEIGLDMGVFPTPGHLVSWAKLSPRTLQSGATRRAGKTGKGNPYLKGVLGEAAAAAAKTDTFLGERYRRLVKRRGKLKALVAIARSVLVIVWHLLADPTARYHDLGAGYYASRIDKDKKARNHTRQLQALGFAVTLTQQQPDPSLQPHPYPKPASPAAAAYPVRAELFRSDPWLICPDGVKLTAALVCSGAPLVGRLTGWRLWYPLQPD